MNPVTLLGYAGGTLVTASFLPQLIKTIKLKETKDLSSATFILLCSSGVLWSAYGTLTRDLPLVIFNIIPLILNLIILGFKFKYK